MIDFSSDANKINNNGALLGIVGGMMLNTQNTFTNTYQARIINKQNNLQKDMDLFNKETTTLEEALKELEVIRNETL